MLPTWLQQELERSENSLTSAHFQNTRTIGGWEIMAINRMERIKRQLDEEWIKSIVERIARHFEHDMPEVTINRRFRTHTLARARWNTFTGYEGIEFNKIICEFDEEEVRKVVIHEMFHLMYHYMDKDSEFIELCDKYGIPQIWKGAGR